MKTKEEILKMSKDELLTYKWSNDLNKEERNKNCYDCSYCSGCSGCSYCSDCYDCSYCSDCYGCRNAEGKKYAICNVEVGKEEYEKKIRELNK